MLSPITITYPLRPAKRSIATNHVADLFGIADSEKLHLVAENLSLDLRPCDLVLFTGPSGSGKSSLMRAVAKQLNTVDVTALSLPEVPLVDALPGSLESRLNLLSACGLAEARLMLRTPSELSDGQRYRFRIAYAVGQCEVLSVKCQEKQSDDSDFSQHSLLLAKRRSENPSPGPSPKRGGEKSLGFDAPPRGGEGLGRGFRTDTQHLPLSTQHFLLLDEFTAPLDRPLAKVVAFNLRKLVSRTGIGVLAATTHEDIADDLNPDVHVRCHGDGHIEVERQAVKKNGSASTTTFGSRPAPSPIGRTSLGGITAPIGSASSAA